MTVPSVSRSAVSVFHVGWVLSFCHEAVGRAWALAMVDHARRVSSAMEQMRSAFIVSSVSWIVESDLCGVSTVQRRRGISAIEISC
jgi:hypothetical protein